MEKSPYRASGQLAVVTGTLWCHLPPTQSRGHRDDAKVVMLRRRCPLFNLQVSKVVIACEEALLIMVKRWVKLSVTFVIFVKIVRRRSLPWIHSFSSWSPCRKLLPSSYSPEPYRLRWASGFFSHHRGCDTFVWIVTAKAIFCHGFDLSSSW